MSIIHSSLTPPWSISIVHSSLTQYLNHYARFSYTSVVNVYNIQFFYTHGQCLLGTVHLHLHGQYLFYTVLLHPLLMSITYIQFSTMVMMYQKVSDAIAEAGVDAHPTDYLNFYCLGNRYARCTGSMWWGGVSLHTGRLHTRNLENFGEILTWDKALEPEWNISWIPPGYEAYLLIEASLGWRWVIRSRFTLLDLTLLTVPRPHNLPYIFIRPHNFPDIFIRPHNVPAISNVNLPPYATLRETMQGSQGSDAILSTTVKAASMWRHRRFMVLLSFYLTK